MKKLFVAIKVSNYFQLNNVIDIFLKFTEQNPIPKSNIPISVYNGSYYSKQL